MPSLLPSHCPSWLSPVCFPIGLIPPRHCSVTIQKSQLTAGQIHRLQPDLGSHSGSALASMGGLDQPLTSWRCGLLYNGVLLPPQMLMAGQ